MENTEGIAIIGIEDFAKIELRVAKVLECEKVEKSDKLLKLKLKCGEEKAGCIRDCRVLFSDSLIGKKLIFLANLKPAKLRGVESQGMILAATHGQSLVLLTVDQDIPDGARVS